MSATTTPSTQENLDERIERIKKRNEELEKKHREAEEDRLAALKDNAMVQTKMPTDNEWPKGHRYDSIDFTYDQKDESDKDDSKKSTGAADKGSKYKKFADGEGPPPDPMYNFLADAERDGRTTEKAPGDKKDWRQQQNSNGSNRNGNRGGGLNNSFRGRNNKPRNGGSNGGGGGVGGDGRNNRYHNKHEHGNNDFNSWKKDDHGERLGDGGSRSKGSDRNLEGGKWRREQWNSDKYNDDDVVKGIKMEKLHINDNHFGNGTNKFHNNKSQNDYNNERNQPAVVVNNTGTSNANTTTTTRVIEMPMEKRGNIMVSISKDGEVKSVKRK